MKKEKAMVKTDADNKALWIYYKGVVQCLECGWHSTAIDLTEAQKIMKEHYSMGIEL